MSSGISDGSLPTEYEKTGHKEVYPGEKKQYELIVGGLYRVLPCRKDVCSVTFASPNRLCIEYAEGYRPGEFSVAEGLAKILELAEKLDPVSTEWASDTALIFENRARWLREKVRVLKAVVIK